MISPQRRQDLVDALRRGTVPRRSLDVFAVGLERFGPVVEEELTRVAGGGAVFKCVRGEYGSGKTFFARWLQEIAKAKGFATSEVQISETETPIHRLETVYRRAMERLSTSEADQGALRAIIDGWFYCLEEDVLARSKGKAHSTDDLLRGTEELLDGRLAAIAKANPSYAAALRGYRRALAAGQTASAEGLVAWIGGQPNVAATHKREAGIKGEIDHFGALTCLQGLLTILRDSGKPGVVLVLDEVETLQRVRGDVREKSLNAIRQLIDEVDAGRFPGLYLLITGTPSFYDGPQGVQRLAPLAQRLHVDFATEARFDNPRAVQIRLPSFDFARLVEVGRKVRDLYAAECSASERVGRMVDDRYLEDLARATAGKLGGKVGVAPRLFLKKLVSDVLDRVDQFPDFDPRKHYAPTVFDTEMTDQERGAARGVDDIPLEV